MRILDLRALKGPNQWSIRRHKLVQMRLDLEDLEELPTNKIEGFLDRLQAQFPSMYEHRCSEGVPGGFFIRVKEGTWMGHVVEHVALELQSLAGMETGFGRTRSTADHGVYHVVFSYIEEKAGLFAAKAAVRICEALVAGETYDLEPDLQELREIRENERLGPSTASIVDEAAARGIPWIRLNNYSLVQLGWGANQKRIQATVASTTGSIAVEIACDKEDTKALLESYEIPVPKGRMVADAEELERAVKVIGYPLVIKPIDGNHGRGITTNINGWDDALTAMDAAKRASKNARRVIVEKYITGRDHRVLVINYRMVAAALRTPASVTGDGEHTISELIEIVNADPRRGYGHEKVLTKIKLDDSTHRMLEKQELTLETVLEKGRQIHLQATANLSTGGTSTDVTDTVHPDNVFMFERIARIIGLDICGIDVMAHDLTQPLQDIGGAILEVNAAPGFRMHVAPAEGLPRNVAEPVVDMLFPPGSSARIPIIAVTGTNGKTTTTRLTAHIMKTVGNKVGFTTTDGIYIQNRMLMKGDCTGPVSARFVLKDPTVDFAVLECARGGILREGLGFDHCDIAIVTNIAADHLGLKDIHTLEDLARVKGVVPESVKPDGYAILNAEDDLVYAMRDNLKCKIALFSMDENNPRVRAHCRAGGLAAIYENGYVTISKGEWKIRVEKAANIPLTFGGRAQFMTNNVLPAILAAFLRGVSIEDLRVALGTFIPSPTQTPGRMNLFRFRRFEIMVDYAHNTAGLEAIAKFLEKVDAPRKVGVISGVGDRRDEDIISLGATAAGMFDEIVIRQDRNLRGRTEEELIRLMTEGIHQRKPGYSPVVIPEEHKAIEHAVRTSQKGDFIVVCSDVVPDALNQIMQLKEEEDKS